MCGTLNLWFCSRSILLLFVFSEGEWILMFSSLLGYTQLCTFQSIVKKRGKERERETERQRDRDRHTDRQIDRLSEIWTETETDGWAKEYTNRETDGQK